MHGTARAQREANWSQDDATDQRDARVQESTAAFTSNLRVDKDVPLGSNRISVTKEGMHIGEGAVQSVDRSCHAG